MQELVRFGVSAEADLINEFDRLVNERGYNNRSEALRDLMRDALVRSHIESETTDSEVLGSLTLVYDHHARELTEKMNELQHEHHELVVSAVHVHLSHHDCLEVIILRGQVNQVRLLANGLLSLKGVKHGDLFLTVPAGKIHRSHKEINT
jgi:CopG family transcriptional regulator, nickel-responsive regulator